MAVELIAKTLFPLKAVAWGDLALDNVGVPTVICVSVIIQKISPQVNEYN
jgi:hypothetical protein